MSERKGDYIQVYSGKQFWPLDPRPEDIDINDIAHALSMQCRFSGHTSVFYSVASHSCMVAMSVVEPSARLWALLHDASEAYLQDVSTPIKHDPFMKRYREVESALQAAIFRRFGLFGEAPETVVEADRLMLRAEAEQLMTPCDNIWGKWFEGIPKWNGRLIPRSPQESKELFLQAFYTLYDKWKVA